MAGVATLCLATAAHAQTQPVAPIVGRATAVASPAQGGMDAAIAALRANQWGKAVEFYRPLVNLAVPEQRAQARYGLAVALAQLGQEDKALSALEGTLSDGTPLGKAVGALRAGLLLQLADEALAEKGPGAAGVWLAQYERLADQPDRARYERIRAAGDLVAGSGPTLVLRVGVMVPLSGALRDVGDGMVRAMQLGLRDFDGRRGTRIELLPVDVSDPGQAKAAAEQLLAQGVDAVVGPLLSRAVDDAEDVLGPAGVPILALSSDRGVVGKGVHALNYLPAEQARLVAQAAVSAGRSRLAGLAPASPYGYEVFDAFQDEAKRLGATVTGSSFYSPQATDIGQNIRSLVGTVSGSVPFDSLFVPAPAASMQLIAAQLAYYDVDKAGVQLLGSSLWQNNTLLTPAGDGLRGGLFAAPPRAQGFEASYGEVFGSVPHPLAVLGYDAVRILADVAGEKQRLGKPVGELLLRPEGFYGSGGFARFTPTGVTQRGLDVVKVGEAQFEVVTPALNMAPLPVPSDLQPRGEGRGWNTWW